jgi:RimJ/RimL family protein N-acetyltransferase
MADTSFTCLRSARLTLRRLRAEDMECFCAYRSRPEVARYQDWDQFSRADGEGFLAEQEALFPDMPGTWFQMGIELTATGALLGDCGLHCHLADSRQAEVGITLAPEHQGGGYAAEALGCLLDYVFFVRHKHRVTATVDAENVPALRLLERLGLRKEGHFIKNVWFKGKWGDECLYAVLHDEWTRVHRLSTADGSRRESHG